MKLLLVSLVMATICVLFAMSAATWFVYDSFEPFPMHNPVGNWGLKK